MACRLADHPDLRGATVSRLQLALNVNDLDAAVEFYSTLFDSEPAKRRPGYANFAIADPALKLVLFENPERTGTLNHLGVERESLAEVRAEADRLEAAGLTPEAEADVECCYARQDKHWVTGPDGQKWENYVVLGDAHPELEGRDTKDVSDLGSRDDTMPTNDGCCQGSDSTDSAERQAVAAGACCG
jgi:catechol 2,3-dioxygenase-like lactoylglutathione lyase family enzyme